MTPISFRFAAFDDLLRASCALAGAGDVSPPEHVQITPRGTARAADGRQFDFSNLPAIVAATRLPLLVDVDHSSTKQGGSTAAAGWVQHLAMSEGVERPPGLWARVEWTPMGADLVRSKAYRFVAPTLRMEKASTRVAQLLSVALTNTPALSMTALHHARAAARFSLTRPSDLERLQRATGLTPDEVRAAQEYNAARRGSRRS